MRRHAVTAAVLWLSLARYAAGQTFDSRPRHIFMFGDSYSATLFNSTEELPSRDNLFGNPAYPGLTSSNGSNWVDYLVYEFNETQPGEPITLCYDYAWPGASVIRLPRDMPVPNYYAFEDQTKLFEANAGSIDWNSTDSIMISWFGINDSGLNVALGLGPQEPKKSFAQTARTYFQQLDTFYRYGGRNFLVLSVPPVWRAPVAITHNSSPQVQTSVGLFNTALAREAYSFQTSHLGSQVSIFDPTSAVNEVLDNFADYGAPDATCTNENRTVNDCLWQGEAHPSSTVHMSIARAAYAQLQSLGFYRNEFSASVPKPVDSSAQRNMVGLSGIGVLLVSLISFFG